MYAKGGRYNLNWYKLTCISSDVLVLSGDENGNNSMIGTWTPQVVEGDFTYYESYLGYVSFLDKVPETTIDEGNYRYLVMTYNGDISTVNLEFVYLCEGAVGGNQGPFWFNSYEQDSYFVTADGSDIPLFVEDNTTICN